MIPGFINEEKKRLRNEFRQKRRDLSAEQVRKKSEQIAHHFFTWPVYQKCETIMLYLAMPDEVQTELIIKDAFERRKQVCAPLLGKNFGEMTAAEITSLDDLLIGKYGLKMPDPSKAKIVSPALINLVVAPGVSFDRNGNRLGLGAGYYDRFFNEAIHSVRAGITFDIQLSDKLPNEAHDRKMHYLITENGVIVCR